MKLKHIKASDWNFRDEIVFNSLEDLINYIKELECQSIIISYDKEFGFYLQDYDDYVE